MTKSEKHLREDISAELVDPSSGILVPHRGFSIQYSTDPHLDDTSCLIQLCEEACTSSHEGYHIKWDHETNVNARRCTIDRSGHGVLFRLAPGASDTLHTNGGFRGGEIRLPTRRQHTTQHRGSCDGNNVFVSKGRHRAPTSSLQGREIQRWAC